MVRRSDDDSVHALFPSLGIVFGEAFEESRCRPIGGVVAAASLCLFWRDLYFLSCLFFFGCVHPSSAEAGCGLYGLYHLDVICLSLIKLPLSKKKEDQSRA